MSPIWILKVLITTETVGRTHTVECEDGDMDISIYSLISVVVLKPSHLYVLPEPQISRIKLMAFVNVLVCYI